MPYLRGKARDYPSLMKHHKKTKRKTNLITKVNRSYTKLKRNNLMVNPNYKINNRNLIPDKFRSRLAITHGARESVGAAQNGNFSVRLNGLALPLNTGAPPPGLMIDGSVSSAATANPLGFLDIMGSSASPGLYDSYVVLNVSYKITYFPLGLNDSQYVITVPNKSGTAIGSINSADEFPYSKGPKFMVGYNSTSANTIIGRLNMAKFLGYASDQLYASDANSRGTRTTNPATINLVDLYVARAAANGTVLTSPLPYKIEIFYDVEFQRQSRDFTE